MSDDLRIVLKKPVTRKKYVEAFKSAVVAVTGDPKEAESVILRFPDDNDDQEVGVVNLTGIAKALEMIPDDDNEKFLTDFRDAFVKALES